jgi:hypothetical protein
MGALLLAECRGSLGRQVQRLTRTLNGNGGASMESAETDNACRHHQSRSP